MNPSAADSATNPAGNADSQTMPAPRVTAKGRATRSRLMAKAQDELIAHGTFEIADVAGAAGVAQSVIHRHFGNKAGLVDAVVSAFYDDYDQAVFLADIAPEATWLDRERLRIKKEIDFLYDHPLGRRVAAGLLHEAAATRVDAERQRRHAEAAARNIRHGQKTGELSPAVNADLVGAAIIGALRAVLAAAHSQQQPPTREEVSDTVILLARALLHPAQPD